MRVSIKNTWLLTFGLTVGAVMPATAAEIYKTVDENGNPVYTDRAPSPDAKPITLRELSVVETPTYTGRTSAADADDDDGGDTLNDLRARYRDFRLVSPAPEQNYWGTANTAQIAWDTAAPLGSDLGVVFFIDGQPITEPTRNAAVTTERLDRGEHRASADLVNSEGTVVASAGPVTFFIMQQSRQAPRPQPRAGGG